MGASQQARPTGWSEPLQAARDGVLLRGRRQVERHVWEQRSDWSGLGAGVNAQPRGGTGSRSGFVRVVRFVRRGKRVLAHERVGGPGACGMSDGRSEKALESRGTKWWLLMIWAGRRGVLVLVQLVAQLSIWLPLRIAGAAAGLAMQLRPGRPGSRAWGQLAGS